MKSVDHLLDLIVKARQKVLKHQIGISTRANRFDVWLFPSYYHCFKQALSVDMGVGSFEFEELSFWNSSAQEKHTVTLCYEGRSVCVIETETEEITLISPEDSPTPEDVELLFQAFEDCPFLKVPRFSVVKDAGGSMAEQFHGKLLALAQFGLLHIKPIERDYFVQLSDKGYLAIAQLRAANEPNSIISA